MFDTSKNAIRHTRTLYTCIDLLSDLGGLFFGLHVLGTIFMAIFGYGDLNAAIIEKTFKKSTGSPVQTSSVKLHGAKGEIAKRIPVSQAYCRWCRSKNKFAANQKAETRLAKHLDVVEIVKK